MAPEAGAAPPRRCTDGRTGSTSTVVDRGQQDRWVEARSTDRWRSVLLVAAAIGLVSGLDLLRLEELAGDRRIDVLAIGIALASAASVFVLRAWTGALVVGFAIAALVVLLLADTITVRSAAVVVIAWAAGLVIAGMPREHLGSRGTS